MIALIKPGLTTYPEIDIECRRIIMEGLQKLGIINPQYSIDELFNASILMIFMPHSLGHLFGLDLHDVETAIT